MFSGAKVNKTSSQAVTAGKITFDTTEYDTHSYFDNANDQFTIPVGVTKARVTAQMLYTADVADTQIKIRKNTTEVAQTGGDMTFGAANVVWVGPVAPGDIFDIYNGGTAATVAGTPAYVWFAIEAVDGPLMTADPIVTHTSSFTFAASEMGSYVRLNHASVAIDALVPSNASVPIPVGSKVSGRQAGAAICTFVADTGVTINAPRGGTLVLGGERATYVLEKVGTDEWDLIGDTVHV